MTGVVTVRPDHDIPTCAELLTRMVADAEAIIKGRLAGMLAS